jgi:cation transport ATPase
MAILWGVVILFIVIWAYKILFWWVAWDKARWKGNIINALTWFVIACSARLIISILLQNLK